MMPISAKLLLATLRLYDRHRNRRGPVAWLVRAWAHVVHLILSVVTASDLQLGARIGRQVTLPHPCGVVMHRDAVVGDGCMILQQVTIGMASGPGVPRIGAGVYLGAGARILGAVTVGDDARVGANAVVLADVPASATVVGVPARIVRIRPASERAEPSDHPGPSPEATVPRAGGGPTGAPGSDFEGAGRFSRDGGG